MKRTCWFCLLVFLAFGAGPVFAQVSPYGEPILLPNAATAADPSVIWVDGVYYLYPTTTQNSVECWSSADMEAWFFEGVVWGPAPAGAWNDDQVWAPDVFVHDGKYYLYYSANLKIGVAVADHPAGPFVDVYDHPMIGAGNGNTLFRSIDAHVFADDDGALYMYCTFYLPFSGLRVSPMNDPVTVTGQWEHLMLPNVFSWERFINEGAWVLKHQGTYYLMYSGDGANLPGYSLGYATAHSPLGPFEKFEGNPILSQDANWDFWGPGHNSVTTDDSGRLWMFYHTKTTSTVSWDRRIRKNRIDYDDQGDLYVVLFDDDDDDDNDDNDNNDDSIDDDDSNSDSDSEDDDGCCG